MGNKKIETNPVDPSGVRPGIAYVADSESAAKARQALSVADRVVVVTKCRYMGDTLVATPFFAQLRKRLPHAHITLLTAPSAAEALANCPYLDEVLSLTMRGVARWRYSQELFTTLKAGRYDAAFIVDRSLRCAVLCALAGVPTRIGYLNEHRRPFLTVSIPYYFDRNEVDCHLDMLRAIGLPAEDALPELWISDSEKNRARHILNEHGLPANPDARPLIGIQPGANDPEIREWGAERYARVADALVEKTGGSLVIMGGSAERETAQRLANTLHHPAINLVGALKLRDALAVIGQCDLWLGNDTGLLHAAVSQRVPSVGLFGPNKIVRWGYDTPRHRSLVHFPETPALDDAAVRRCLDAISEETVLETACEVLRVSCQQPSVPKTPEPATPPYFAARATPATLISTRRR